MIRRTMCLVILAFVLTTGDSRSPIKQDERVVFFPTWGWQSADGTWNVRLHGWVFEPETDSLKRAAALKTLRITLGLDADTAESERFQQRARAFLVDNERGKTIYVRIGGRAYLAGTSSANGHFSADVVLNNSGPLAAGPRPFQAVLDDADTRVFAGTLHLIEPTGVSVISDLDDTVKVSNVLNKRELLANTFQREFQPVPRMSDAYQRWARAGVRFHYVSGSPWQLYEPLWEFLDKHKFPPGTVHLRNLRLKDRSAVDFLKSPLKAKLAAIEPLLATYPKRRFILVGDSGEQDPEVYATIARKHPQQVRHIFIRNVTDEAAGADRYRQTFEKLPAGLWTVFDDPQVLTTFRP